MKKLKNRKFPFAKGHTVSKCQRQDLNPGSLTLEPTLSITRTSHDNLMILMEKSRYVKSVKTSEYNVVK